MRRLSVALAIHLALLCSCTGSGSRSPEIDASAEPEDKRSSFEVASCDFACLGWECGVSGLCNCGDCEEGEACTAAGECVAVAVCSQVCEAYSCGVFFGCDCGSCPAGQLCDEAGQCVQNPCSKVCEDRQCGDFEGCDCGKCAPGVCNEFGKCEMVEECNNVCALRECGSVGDCDCGTCPEQHVCLADGMCFCLPACQDKPCGADGCGGSCGTCAGVSCPDGGIAKCDVDTCVCGCLADCDGKSCGSDGCGGLCGDCDDDNSCTEDFCSDGVCVHESLPACCGEDLACDDGVACTEDFCLEGAGCVHTWISPCCGDGKLEGEEECDDGNGDTMDGCTQDCKLEPYFVFVGYSYQAIDCKYQSDEVMDMKLNEGCAAEYGPKALAASVTVFLGQEILLLQESNQSDSMCVFTCPQCEGGPYEDCLEGHGRVCAWKGESWPETFEELHQTCTYDSKYCAICVVPLIDFP